MITLLDGLRKEANALFKKAGVPMRPPFLRRAENDDFLLCSDAPRRLSDPARGALLFQEAGLILYETGSLWFLDIPAARYVQLDETLQKEPPGRPSNEKYLDVWALCRMLMEHPCPIVHQPLWAVRQTVKAIEAGEAAVLSLAEKLPPRLAELMRKKEPLPFLAGKLLALWLNEMIRKETV